MADTKILLVEDDQNFGDVLKSYLEMNDFDVELAVDGEEGANAFKNNTYDMCILDVMMPKKDGFTLGKEIRAIDKNIPIIFLTARSLKQDVLEGFEIGADDYISKPFNSEELLARVKAILKRNQARDGKKEEDAKEFDLGIFHFNFPLRILTNHRAKTDEKLSPKEAQLLKMFCEYKNEVLPRSAALEKIWGKDDYFTARSMDVFIAKLRKYLSTDENIEIDNIHGDGFRLVVTE